MYTVRLDMGKELFKEDKGITDLLHVHSGININIGNQLSSNKFLKKKQSISQISFYVEKL